MTPPIDTPTILIVDDTPSNLSVVVNLFEDRGYRVAIAQDGEEGLQRAQLVQPDLILLDVMMPGIDGFEACRRLKAQESTRDIPVIFMTALASAEHKVRGFGAGAVDYVTKPLQIDEVMARVETHLKLSAAQKKLAEHNEELERRVAERTAELAAREREFRTLVENAPDEIARHDRQGRFIYINPQHEQTLGIPLANLVGKTPVECFPGIPGVVAYQACLMEVIATGRSLEYEATLPDAGDGPRYHSVLLVAECGEDGEIVGVLAIGRDITELKRADAALRERELRYRQLFENSPISIWEEDFSAVHRYFEELRQAGVEDLVAYFDAHPEAVGHCAELVRIVDVNQAAVTLHRAQSKAELFAGLQQTFTPDSFRAFRQELIGLWRGETEMRLDAVVRTLAGEPRHVTVQFSIAPDTGNPWSRMLVSLVDITERKQAEQQLAMLGAAIDHAHEAAYFVDEHGGFFYVNEEASRMLGYSREALLGMTVMDIAPGWTPQVMAESWQAISKVGAFTIEAEHRHKDGRIVPVEINITHMNYGGRAFNLAMVRDITERKRTERELLLLNLAVNASTEAAFLSDAQGRFVYVNEEACRSLGYRREELLGMTPVDIDPDVTDEVLAGLLESIFTHGPTKSPMESRHRTRDGRIFPIEIAASPLKLEGDNYCLTMVRDITERKRTERELHEKEQAIRAVVENSPDTIIRYDSQCRRIYLNPAMEKIFGQPREQLHGTSPAESSILPEQYLDTIKKVLETGREQRMESSFRNAEGETCWVDLRLAPEFGADGKVATVLAIGRDITERKRAEEELAVREREFRTLAENIPDNIIRYDRNCRKVYLNTATARLMGIKPEEVLNLSPEETPQDKRAMKIDVFAERLRRVLETGEPQEMEVTMRHVEKGMQVHNVRFVAERDEQGAIVGALMVGRDITAMKDIENELTERELRYREIFDNAVEGMYLLEVTEEGRFRNLDINPALAASTGIPREAMIGKFVDEAVPGEASRLSIEKYRRCLAVGKTIEEEVEFDLPAGRRHYLSTITPIYSGGRIHRLIGISRDITELKRAERALEESRAQLRGLTARREEAREEERKYIAREVHDELGQILTGLQLNVSVLNHKFAGDSPALREQLQETRGLTDRALAVARNVASALRPAALDMGIVSALEWLVGRFRTNTGIHCEVHAEDADIQLDESQAIALFRIVQESLTNVARHAKADRIDIDFGVTGDDYSLKVRDNGTGFDEKTAKADSFGLVGMRERALLLGGEVVIKSKPGEGTEVEVRIPAHNVSRLS
ncbi:MAG TPA: PAS domain S-box protein [Gallionella sp.]|nr:PAS domain S-box protein [Gallionella sp.]